MRSFVAFLKKEAIEALRSGRALILFILFFAFGIMNPAIAKLTPWIMELLAESLAESGMTVTALEVNALTSWTQFFKNIPMALIVVLLMHSGALTGECASGTLIPLLTKGLARYKVILAKLAAVLFIWSVGYWLCYFVTYFYNAYFWDNGIAVGLLPAVLFWWLFGMFTICLCILFSSFARSYAGVLLGTGTTVLLSYLLGFLPKLKYAVPTSLMSSAALLVGLESSGDYTVAAVMTVALSILSAAVAVVVFNKRQL